MGSNDAQLVEASDGKTFTVINPATRETSAQGKSTFPRTYISSAAIRALPPEASADDTNSAVAAAKAAFPACSAMGATKRSVHLKKLASLLRENKDELARPDAVAMGVPVSTHHNALLAATHFDYYSGAWATIQGQASVNTPGWMTMALQQPYGVVALIIPWNVPFQFLAAISAPALITGNTFVLKPSKKAPPAVARITELVVRGRLPARCLQHHLRPRCALRSNPLAAY